MSKTAKPIRPMGFLPKTDFKARIYWVGFPARWKSELYRIRRIENPGVKEDKALKTAGFKSLALAWLDGAVYVEKLDFNTSESDRWLISGEPIDLDKLLDMVKIWLISLRDSLNIKDKTAEALAKKEYEALISSVQKSELIPLTGEGEERLFDDGGRILKKPSYSLFPYLVRNKLVGKSIVIGDREFPLFAVGPDELITEPVFYGEEKRRDGYSYVIGFSLQSLPPDERAILLIKCSVRRWLGKHGGYLRLDEEMNAHIRLRRPSGYRYYVLPVKYDYGQKRKVFREDFARIYKLYESDLPDAEAVVSDPPAFSGREDCRILCPVSNQMKISDICVGTGVGVLEKHYILTGLYAHLADEVTPVTGVERIKGRAVSYRKEFDPDAFFRAIGSDSATVEIYARDCDSDVADALQARLAEDFAGHAGFRIERPSFDQNDFLSPLTKDCGALKRAFSIRNTIPKSSEVVGALVVLDGKDSFDPGTDPKDAIRSGFALANRLTQFVTPQEYRVACQRCDRPKPGKKTDEPDKIQNIDKAVKDLYRQFGYLCPVASRKVAPLIGVPVMGLTLFANRETYFGKAVRLPIFVSADFASGQIFVECEAFTRPRVLYKEAGIEIAKLCVDGSIEEKARRAEQACIKRKMIDLEHVFAKKDLIFLFEADRNTRNLTVSIHNEAIWKNEGYQSGYLPEKIDFGTKESSYYVSLKGTGVRVFRIRTNQEVPDYTTEIREDKNAASSSSGIYRYDRDFWCLAPKRGDFIDTYNKTREEERTSRVPVYYRQRNVIEIFPMQLQEGDDVEPYLNYLNSLRDCVIQFEQKTDLPLPLHLGRCLEEYFFIKPRTKSFIR